MISNCCASTLNECFSKDSWHGTWSGADSSFFFSKGLLRMEAPPKGKTAYITTKSKAVDDAEWNFHVELYFKPSGSNYCRLYLASSEPALTDTLNGYYIQIGNSKGQVLLYRQKGKSTKKIAAGVNGRLDRDTVRVDLNVTRNHNGEWHIASKLDDEAHFTDSFSTKETTFTESFYSGIYCKYSSKHCSDFAFGCISIKGKDHIDTTPPHVVKHSCTTADVKVTFSEPIDFSSVIYAISPALEVTARWEGTNTLVVAPSKGLNPGEIHTIDIEEYTDRYDNPGKKYTCTFGAKEEIEKGDIAISEVMFDAAENCTDYVEIHNISEKLVDLADLMVATYRADTAIYAAKKLPTYILRPGGYVAICEDEGKLRECHGEAGEAVAIEKLPTWGASSGSVVVCNLEGLVLDDFKYSATMHSPYIKKRKGTSLERTTDRGEVWASAVDGGTPGKENSNAEQKDGNKVSLANGVCHPNGDKDGFVRIEYTLSLAHCAADVTIYNLAGAAIRHLVKNKPVGTHGCWIWDGRDDNGNIVPISPYVILISFYDNDGFLMNKKIVCTVTE